MSVGISDKQEERQTAPVWETIANIQGDLLKAQGVLIDQLTQERDEARHNLKTATAQWVQWRKELCQ